MKLWCNQVADNLFAKKPEEIDLLSKLSVPYEKDTTIDPGQTIDKNITEKNLTLPYLTLPYLTLPYLTLPYQTVLVENRNLKLALPSFKLQIARDRFLSIKIRED